MKQNSYIGLAILAGMVTLSACNKKLEEYNPSNATEESLFKTAEGFETAVNGAYTYNRNLYGKEEGFALLEAGTDLWAPSAKNGNSTVFGSSPNPAITTYSGLLADNYWVNTNLWTPCYAAINLCNTALGRIDEAGLTPARRQSAEAELRFMRAWYYFLLVQAFGDVHFTLEPTKGMVTVANRTSVVTVYEQIVNDMQFAAGNLPVTTADYGRITKTGALAILSKVLLTKGDYQAASNLAKVVIDESGQGLLPRYADLWQMANETNNEVLWAVNYATNLNLNAPSGNSGHRGHSLFLMEYSDLPGMKQDVVNGFPEGRWIPTLHYLDLFNEAIDSRFDATFKQAWLANNASTIPVWTVEEVSHNPALAARVGQPKYTVGDTAIWITKKVLPNADQLYTHRYRYKTYDRDDLYNSNGTVKNIRQYFSLKKFDDPTRATAAETNSARNAPIIRLAEVYLNAAEAQFRLGKLDSAARFINSVRRRAALPGHADAMEITGAMVTTDFILDERARELGGEQTRWFDLKRLGQLEQRVKMTNPDIAANIRPYHLLRPIPLAQLGAVTNKDEFKQNPGYE
ncbi:RagB/SusD family nutrient uptake outer membrane protein [Sphingobacterium suaedae]|uniref:RagB/SusD family nutrient uptake outer membrane protein n=1 Tax=Sphingobacterium suaedae TaxID=1686402 RepID=A0ABW5KIY7_9SPHI